VCVDPGELGWTTDERGGRRVVFGCCMGCVVVPPVHIEQQRPSRTKSEKTQVSA